MGMETTPPKKQQKKRNIGVVARITAVGVTSTCRPAQKMRLKTQLTKDIVVSDLHPLQTFIQPSTKKRKQL